MSQPGRPAHEQYCETCDCWQNGEEMMRIHLTSKLHKKNLRLAGKSDKTEPPIEKHPGVGVGWAHHQLLVWMMPTTLVSETRKRKIEEEEMCSAKKKKKEEKGE